jgi:hypothetical protein
LIKIDNSSLYCLNHMTALKEWFFKCNMHLRWWFFTRA